VRISRHGKMVTLKASAPRYHESRATDLMLVLVDPGASSARYSSGALVYVSCDFVLSQWYFRLPCSSLARLHFVRGRVQRLRRIVDRHVAGVDNGGRNGRRCCTGFPTQPRPINVIYHRYHALLAYAYEFMTVLHTAPNDTEMDKL
jgi:hypothetical protein